MPIHLLAGARDFHRAGDQVCGMSLQVLERLAQSLAVQAEDPDRRGGVSSARRASSLVCLHNHPTDRRDSRSVLLKSRALREVFRQEGSNFRGHPRESQRMARARWRCGGTLHVAIEEREGYDCGE